MLGVGTTGYAKDILKDVLGADVALVETVAHTQGGAPLLPGRGRHLRRGRAGHQGHRPEERAGEGLQAQHAVLGGQRLLPAEHRESFGYEVEEFADTAFAAESMPDFGYGCAVFLQSDIVDFQRQGWQPPEIMAGLAAVLPKNIWLYVAQMPNLAQAGHELRPAGRHAAQPGGGQGAGRLHRVAVRRQRRHAARSSSTSTAARAVRSARRSRRVRLCENGRRTHFIGLDAVQEIAFITHRGEDTRCYFCKNKCLRTFIDVTVEGSTSDDRTGTLEDPAAAGRAPADRRQLVREGTGRGRRLMREIKKGLDAGQEGQPELDGDRRRGRLAQYQPARGSRSAARRAPHPGPEGARRAGGRARDAAHRHPPRAEPVLAQPLFSGATSSRSACRPRTSCTRITPAEELYKDGAKRGSIDPCFPSKLGIPHVHNLLYQHAKKPLDVIFFPMIDALTSPLAKLAGQPGVPDGHGHARGGQGRLHQGGRPLRRDGHAVPGPDGEHRRAAHCWRARCSPRGRTCWGCPRGEPARGASGLRGAGGIRARLRAAAREVLEQLEREDRIGIVVLGRPYHNDPGINHEILEEFQKLGYPIVHAGHAADRRRHRLDACSATRSRRAHLEPAGHRRRVEEHLLREHQPQDVGGQVHRAAPEPGRPRAVELQVRPRRARSTRPSRRSSRSSGTPYFCFKDIDENKPTGSIKIRIETIGYFLKRYREDMVRSRARRVRSSSGSPSSSSACARRPRARRGRCLGG